MKKQWLSIVLVLCMVLCLTPTTARAAEDNKTCTLTIKVEVQGLYGGVDAGGKTFSFEILRKYATYGHYENVDITIKSGETAGTVDVPVEEGTYVVKQDVPGKPIGEYVWDGISYQPSSSLESGPQSVYGDGKSITFKVYNTYKSAEETKVTTLPITVTGYKAGANVKDARVTTTEPGIDLSYFRFMEKNSDGTWTPAPLTETFKENTDYKVEVYFNKIPECNYTGLTGDSVTVNGVKAGAFETTWSGFPYNKDYRVIHGLGKPEVVKKVERIEITTQPAKTEYKGGDKFDPTGMVVTAHYTDGTTAVLSRDQYVIFYGDKLTQGQTDVTIQYNDGSHNSGIKVDLHITVKPYVGTHTHTYAGSKWYADTDSHWHQCTDTDCPDPRASTKDLAPHTFVWKVDKAATKTQAGLKHEECTVCGHERSKNTVIPMLSGSSAATPGTTIPGTTGGTTGAAKSPKTGDAGIALYAGLSLLALSGSGWVVGKKRRGEK